jgi:hypothetical protein
VSPSGRTRAATLALSCVLGALALAGCAGKTGTTSTPAALKLQREDLVAVVRVLKAVQRPLAYEVATTKRVWPQLAAGPVAERAVSGSARGGGGVQAVTGVKVPALFGELQSRSLTGPAASIAGSFRYAVLLITRGWTMALASSAQTTSSSPAAARFARENIGLYIESIYDGHFTLAQIGKKLQAGYGKLGGPTAFGAALTQAEVDALASVYSEANERLHPHPPVLVGS